MNRPILSETGLTSKVKAGAKIWSSFIDANRHERNPYADRGEQSLALRFGQVWSKGDIKIVDELASPDLRVSYPSLPAPVEGLAAFKEVLKMVHTAFPDIEIEIGEPLAESNRVAAAGTMRGTHQGDMMGLPPTGKCVNWSGSPSTGSKTEKSWTSGARKMPSPSSASSEQ